MNIHYMNPVYFNQQNWTDIKQNSNCFSPEYIPTNYTKIFIFHSKKYIWLEIHVILTVRYSIISSVLKNIKPHHIYTVQIGAILFCFIRLRFLTKRVRGGHENEKVGVSKYFEAGGFTNILPHGKKRMSTTAAVQNTSKLLYSFFHKYFTPR